MAATRRSPPFLGIDHTALAVSNTGRSIRFYRRLGLRVAYRSRNFGPAQARLDGLPGARAGITGLRSPASSGPGIELLGTARQGAASRSRPTNCRGLDHDPRPMVRRSAHAARPDGHRLLLVGSPSH